MHVFYKSKIDHCGILFPRIQLNAIDRNEINLFLRFSIWDTTDIQKENIPWDFFFRKT